MKKEIFKKLISNKKNIIFDFGGIFIDVDYSKAFKNLSRLSQKDDLSTFYSKANQHKVFDAFEVGDISSSDFILKLKKEFLIDASDEDIIAAWNSMIGNMKIERLHFLKELKETKKVYLLSNINELHESYIEKYLSSNKEFKDFYQNFQGVYLSHKIGYRKPDIMSFYYVLRENNLSPNETVFLDDSAQHVESALKIGLTAIHLEKSNTFIV